MAASGTRTIEMDVMDPSLMRWTDPPPRRPHGSRPSPFRRRRSERADATESGSDEPPDAIDTPPPAEAGPAPVEAAVAPVDNDMSSAVPAPEPAPGESGLMVDNGQIVGFDLLESAPAVGPSGGDHGRRHPSGRPGRQQRWPRPPHCRINGMSRTLTIARSPTRRPRRRPKRPRPTRQARWFRFRRPPRAAQPGRAGGRALRPGRRRRSRLQPGHGVRGRGRVRPGCRIQLRRRIRRARSAELLLVNEGRPTVSCPRPCAARR